MNAANSGPLKYTDFTQQEIENYLDTLKGLVSAGLYMISRNSNRLENVQFVKDYKINTEKEREILLNLICNDFCYAVDNVKPDYANEKLYIFKVTRDLNYFGQLETVDIYIKTNITKTRKGDQFVIVISFHKANKKINRLFE